MASADHPGCFGVPALRCAYCSKLIPSFLHAFHLSQYPIAVVVGSLLRDSINRKLAAAIAKLAPPEFSFNQIDIGDLPHYNQDDDGTPESVMMKVLLVKLLIRKRSTTTIGPWPRRARHCTHSQTSTIPTGSSAHEGHF